MVYNFGGGLCSGYAGNPYFNGCLDSKSFGAASFVLVLESLTKVRERKHHFLPSMAGNAGHFLVLVQVAMQTIFHVCGLCSHPGSKFAIEHGVIDSWFMRS
jgi:hypothetical protein